jgi:hypothetical protein
LKGFEVIGPSSADYVGMANRHYYATNDQEEELALKLALEASLADAGSWPDTAAAAAVPTATTAT